MGAFCLSQVKSGGKEKLLKRAPSQRLFSFLLNSNPPSRLALPDFCEHRSSPSRTKQPDLMSKILVSLLKPRSRRSAMRRAHAQRCEELTVTPLGSLVQKPPLPLETRPPNSTHQQQPVLRRFPSSPFHLLTATQPATSDQSAVTWMRDEA